MRDYLIEHSSNRYNYYIFYNNYNSNIFIDLYYLCDRLVLSIYSG